MSNKSPEAFRTISEVSKDLAIPQHVLRFWETKFIQIKPIKRGGGRRYYRPEDVEILKGIKNLLYNDGYTIRGVQKVIKENGTRKILLKSSKVQTKSFTESENQHNDDLLSRSNSHYSMSDEKRKKLMDVLNNLVTLQGNISRNKLYFITMAKKSTVKVRLVPEEKTDSKFYYYAKKPTAGLKAKDKLRLKKYNPATQKHEWFVEKKLPPHSK